MIPVLASADFASATFDLLTGSVGDVESKSIRVCTFGTLAGGQQTVWQCNFIRFLRTWEYSEQRRRKTRTEKLVFWNHCT